MQEHAFEESQKYKEGKFILEKAKVMKVSVPQAHARPRLHGRFGMIAIRDASIMVKSWYWQHMDEGRLAAAELPFSGWVAVGQTINTRQRNSASPAMAMLSSLCNAFFLTVTRTYALQEGNW